MENGRLEPLKSFKARLAAFKRRKTNLLKKANELKILCGVELCMIIYGPKSGDGPSRPETWASGDGELLNIIKRYKETVGGGANHAAQRASSSSRFPGNSVTKAACEETAETVGNNSRKKLFGWDPRFDKFSEDQLRLVVDKVTKKLNAAKLKKMKIRENKEVEDSMQELLQKEAELKSIKEKVSTLQDNLNEAAEEAKSQLREIEEKLNQTLSEVRQKNVELIRSDGEREARELSAALKEIEEEKKQLNDQIRDYKATITQLQEEYVNKMFLLLA